MDIMVIEYRQCIILFKDNFRFVFLEYEERLMIMSIVIGYISVILNIRENFWVFFLVIEALFNRTHKNANTYKLVCFTFSQFRRCCTRRTLLLLE